MTEVKKFKIEDAQLIFRNFEGKEGMYNTAGDRNFCVPVSPEMADQLIADGWNVKLLKPNEEGEPGTPYIQVSVSYKTRPPRVVMITSNGRTNLTEDSINVLDWADIRVADLICNGYEWNINGKTGVKAYLKSLFVTLEEDELEIKYSANEG